MYKWFISSHSLKTEEPRSIYLSFFTFFFCSQNPKISTILLISIHEKKEEEHEICWLIDSFVMDVMLSKPFGNTWLLKLPHNCHTHRNIKCRIFRKFVVAWTKLTCKYCLFRMVWWCIEMSENILNFYYFVFFFLKF